MTERRFSGAVFRADHPGHTDLSATADASRKEPGRFNTSRFGAVYLSCEPDTAIKERRRNEGRVEHPCALFVVSLSVGRILDLTIEGERRRWGLTHDDLTSDDLTRTQQVAQQAFEHAVEAIIWPSATGQGTSVAVLFDRLADGSRLDVVHTFELSPTTLSAVDADAPIAAIHPLVSTFPRARSSP